MANLYDGVFFGPYEITNDNQEYLRYIAQQERAHPDDVAQLRSSYEYLLRQATNPRNYPQDFRDKWVEEACREKLKKLGDR